MEVITAKTAGFCFGVKRAVETVYEQVEKNKGKQIYTYGPIIHNDIVVKDLEDKGVRVIASKEELEQVTEGVVVIRSHGVPEGICAILKEKGISCVDATCPFVKKIHNIVAEESGKGKEIIIVGNESHPEVEGIKGWAKSKVTVLESKEEAEKFSTAPETEICIVSQTTFNYNKFKDIVEIIEKMGYHISVLNTICGATKERQNEAAHIAERVDAMIVIGDRQSSNTQKLFEISKKACNNTYYIQTLDDLELNQLGSAETVGITAGASTPNKIIEEVQKNVRFNF